MFQRGYTNATDATSPVKRIQSSYSLRSITSRTTLGILKTN